MSVLSLAEREAVLARVAAWLDELESPESAPEGLSPEALDGGAGPDLASLLAQMAALTAEVKLQGRAANRLTTELSEALAKLTPPPAPETRRDASHELLVELLDVRDRQSRGLAEAERRLASWTGWRARLGQRPVVEALVLGDRMARERLDDLLRRHDVLETPCAGRAFDAVTMRAVEVDDRATAAPGTVVEVIRSGFSRRGAVVRVAEVRVAGERKGTS